MCQKRYMRRWRIRSAGRRTQRKCVRLRHTTADGYTEGETEDLMTERGETLEDAVIRRMELETLQEAMQSLTQIQRERLHLYFFHGLTFRQIAQKTGVSDKSVRESIEASLKKIKKYFN